MARKLGIDDINALDLVDLDESGLAELKSQLAAKGIKITRISPAADFLKSGGEIYASEDSLTIMREGEDMKMTRKQSKNVKTEQMVTPESEKLTKRRERLLTKLLKNGRKKEEKEKNITVTQGDLEEYNIDAVLKELGEDKPKDEKRKQRKKKSKREKQNREKSEIVTEALEELNIGSASTVNPILDEQEKLNILVQKTESEQIEHKITDDDTTEPECSICFNPRTKSFLFYPCGHATFCEACANRIKIELKKCPTCQNPIFGLCPVFQ